jgi:uncharacterized membrane protein YfcA
LTVAVIALGGLLASGVQAATGLGFALILTPVLFAVMSAVAAVVTITALSLLLNALVLFAERRARSIVWEEVVPILLAAVPGCVVGVLLLGAVPKAALQVATGVAVITAALVLRHRRAQSGPAPRSATRPTWSRLSLGFATGTLSTSTGVNGPPLALWLTARGLTPHRLRDSLSALFLGLGLVAALALIPLAGRSHLAPSAIVAAVASVIGGHAIGSRLFARLSTPRFQQAVLAIIVATGVASVALGLAHA